MQIIGFDEFYKSLKDVIDTAKVKAKISKLTPVNTKKVAKILGNEDGNKIKTFQIMYEDKSIGQGGPKNSYTAFVRKICEDAGMYDLLEKDEWIYGESDKDSSPKDYAVIDDNNHYIYTNCNHDLIMVKCIKILLELNLKNELSKYSFGYKFNTDDLKQIKYELEIAAESVTSTDDRFTMDNLDLGDNYKPIDAYFQKADGEIIRRNRNKSEAKISNQTLPRLAFQIFEKEISSLSDEDKKQFPVC